MISAISAHSVANAIRMKRSVSPHAVAIVEGGSDKRVLSGVLNENTCKIEIAHGKENLIAAAAILNQNKFPGFIGIADADFARLINVHPPANVFFSDYHDLECMLLKSDATRKVFLEFGSEDKLQRFATTTSEVLEKIVVQASKLGCLRLMSLRDGLNLKFEGLKFGKFTDEASLVVDERKLVEHVLNITRNHELVLDAITNLLLEEERKHHDVWELACGHDAMELVAIGFRKTLGNNNATTVSLDAVERAFRLSYSAASFLRSELAEGIMSWETVNSPYIVVSGQS